MDQAHPLLGAPVFIVGLWLIPSLSLSSFQTCPSQFVSGKSASLGADWRKNPCVWTLTAQGKARKRIIMQELPCDLPMIWEHDSPKGWVRHPLPAARRLHYILLDLAGMRCLPNRWSFWWN